MQKLALVVLYEREADVDAIVVRTQVSFEGLRGFVRELRKGRKVSQPDLAEAIGMSPRTYKAWELGNTETIKTHFVIRAVRYLHSNLDLLADIDDKTTFEQGAQIAREWVESNPGSRESVAAAFAPRADETPDVAERLNQLIVLLSRGASPEEIARLQQDLQ